MPTATPTAHRPSHASWQALVLIAVLLGPGCSLPALAAGDGRDTGLRQGLDFALNLSRLTMDLRVDGQTQDAIQKRLGVRIFAETDTTVTYGLLAGSSYLTLDDDPSSAGEQLQGYHFGLALRADLLERPRLRLAGHYLYQQTEAATASDDISVDWYEWQLLTSLRLAPGRQWAVIVAGAYTGADAEQRVRGASPDTLDLTLRDGLQGELTLEMLFPAEGRASVSIVRGNQDGVRFEFARVF